MVEYIHKKIFVNNILFLHTSLEFIKVKKDELKKVKKDEWLTEKKPF